MIIYNVTIKVDHEVHDEWLKWMRETHIHDVVNTGYFEKHQFSRLLDQDETDGITYSIQYFCLSRENYEAYSSREARRLQEEHHQKFKDKFVAFRTLLETIES